MKCALAITGCLLLGACNEPPPKSSDASAKSAADAKSEAETKRGRPDAKLIVAKGVGAKLLEAQRSSACADAMRVRSAVQMHQVSERECPTSVKALVDARFLPDMPLDPWKHEYTIECSEDDVAVHSAGPDGKAGTEDDVVVDGSSKVCG